MADVAIRYRSTLNPWMDCVIFVSEQDQLPAVKAVRSAVDEFFSEGDTAYADCICARLNSCGIHFKLIVCDYDAETDTPTDSWCEWVGKCNIVAEI